MRARLMLAGCVLTLSALGPFVAQADEGGQFTVVDADARIAYPATINGFERLSDDVYLLRVNANRLYRAYLSPGCAEGAFPSFHIGLEPRSPVGFDRRSALRIDALRTCPLVRLERVVRTQRPAVAGD